MLIKLIKMFTLFFRILTTPNDETWPGVSELKDYKPTFPKWSDNLLKDSVKNISNEGLDLLEVN